MVESEDVNFRIRLLWAELHGIGVGRRAGDLLDQAEAAVRFVKGIVGTDSKGGFDAVAVTLQEGPYLGLSNARSAVQAFQLKQSFEKVGTRLIWLSGDWMLADGLTKRSAGRGLLQFLKRWVWMLHYDPNFITSAKKAKKGSDATTVMRAQFSPLHRQ